MSKEDDTMGKRKKKRYVVDVYWTMARPFEVVAKSQEEADDIVNEMFSKGEFRISDGFEPLEEIETNVSGEENENGEIEYY